MILIEKDKENWYLYSEKAYFSIIWPLFDLEMTLNITQTWKCLWLQQRNIESKYIYWEKAYFLEFDYD